MTQFLLVHALLPMLLFAGLIVLALAVRPGDAPNKSAPVRMLILYVVAVSMFAGFSGRDLWPFAAWHYVSYAVGDSGDFVRLVGVDDRGQEHPLDTRVFEPIEFGELLGYLEFSVEGMPRAQRAELLDFLLQRARDGLDRARAGRSVGTFARFLGPASAPIFQWAETPWKDRDHLPEGLTALRLYRVYWRIDGDRIRVENQALLAGTQS